LVNWNTNKGPWYVWLRAQQYNQQHRVLLGELIRAEGVDSWDDLYNILYTVEAPDAPGSLSLLFRDVLAACRTLCNTKLTFPVRRTHSVLTLCLQTPKSVETDY
jgi:hypothetical protein